MEFNFGAYFISIFDCPDVEVHWKIQRSDGEIEVYTVLNETYRFGRQYYLPDRGVNVFGFCSFLEGCYFNIMKIRPTDLRYNGAQITGVVNLPECFNSSNITDPMTLNIQGTLLKL